MKDSLFSLVRISLGIESEKTLPVLSEKEWDQLFGLTCRHNVAGLVADVVCGLPEGVRPTEDITLQFVAMQGMTIFEFKHRQQVAQQLQHFYKKHHLKVNFLKGFQLSRYYPCPELRKFSDLDIYLSYEEGRMEKDPAWLVGDRLVEKELGRNVNRSIHHHTTFEYCGVHVENHFDFISQYVSKNAKYYEKKLKASLVNSPDFNALFLMRHIAGHFVAENISVRNLIDWMLFLKNDGDKVDWERVRPVYENCGMMPFVGAVSDIMKTYLGYDCPYLLASSNVALRERVLCEILYGEFEDKAPTPNQILKRLSFKLRRRWQGRWKHELCSNTSWFVDFGYSIYAKMMKPHTILH